MAIPKPTLHVTILTLFLSFLLVTAGALTWYNYSENTKAAQQIAEQLLSEVNDEVTGRIKYLFRSTCRTANELAELPLLAVKPEFASHPAQWPIAERLLARPHLYSAYIGYADGEFFQVIAMHDKALRERLQAPSNAVLAFRRVFKRPGDGQRVELWQFYDKERRLAGSRGLRHSSYDPTQRPWFRQAIDTEGVVRTPFYIFTSTNSLGLTFAHRFDANVPGVIGVDISLASLSKYFKDQHVGRSGYVFMFDRDLRMTAHPEENKILFMAEPQQTIVRLSLKDQTDRLMSALTKRLEHWAGDESIVLDVDDSRHMVHIAPFKDDNLQGQFLAVTAPLSDFTAHMDRTRQRSLLGAALIILIAIPVAAYNAWLMSSSLKKLAVEADKIRHFKLDSKERVRSHISEISELSKAIKAMQTSLSSFGRYVPKALVEQLLLARMVPELGGERREATLLFSDIADFTTISESMEAEKLMLSVSEYLQQVSVEILRHEGTIDKYIGDAVMAFWNSPAEQEDHAQLACAAALAARDASEALNRRWEAEGQPVMYTRFGLHTGNPIIGNIGSDDRMNFTAMGACVNLASRLEGLNKYYGTQILTSETVVARAGNDFLFRPVGKVMPKGTTSPVAVFELMGRKGGPVGFLDAPGDQEPFLAAWGTAQARYQAGAFDEAADLFEALLAAHPADRLAATMLDRARTMAASPPDGRWGGVDVFKTK